LKTAIRRSLTLLALAPLAACSEPGDAVVARADRHQLTVPEVLTLLLGVQLPNDQNVTFTVAELWVDYTLLATAMAEDSTAANLSVEHIVEEQVQQELLLALRDVEVQPDTMVSDADVESRFAQTAPGVRLRARHIFLGFPQNAAEGGPRDSLRAFARGLHDRVRRGESFEALARQYSHDTRTAAEGGDLGWFGHGDLYGPLETAAFALEPGQVSDVVESQLGLHILRVDERETPTLEDVRPALRTQIQQERVQAAESILVASAEEGADIEVVEGAPALTRRIADDPGLQLSRRARGRKLVRFRGGGLTVGDLVTFMQSRNTQFRMQIYQATDDAIEQNLLRGLAQRKLIAARATEQGIEISEARRDSLSQELRVRIVGAARELGFVPVPLREGESKAQAVDRRVTEVLREMLGEAREVTPLGSFSFILRERYAAQVYPEGVARVMERVAQLRPDSTGAQQQPAAPQGAAAPPAPPMGGPAAPAPPGAAPPP
jgi:peptidyl-prolyl cis-trans isomerase C